jgi:hypothetical protein
MSLACPTPPQHCVWCKSRDNCFFSPRGWDAFKTQVDKFIPSALLQEGIAVCLKDHHDHGNLQSWSWEHCPWSSGYIGDSHKPCFMTAEAGHRASCLFPEETPGHSLFLGSTSCVGIRNGPLADRGRQAAMSSLLFWFLWLRQWVLLNPSGLTHSTDTEWRNTEEWGDWLRARRAQGMCSASAPIHSWPSGSLY